MRWIGFVCCLFCLACGGMMDIFVPDLPIELPARGVRVFAGREEGALTQVDGVIEAMDHEAICQHFTTQLQGGGWRVERNEEGAETVLTGRRGPETLEVRVSGPAPYAAAGFKIRWTQADSTGG